MSSQFKTLMIDWGNTSLKTLWLDDLNVFRAEARHLHQFQQTVAENLADRIHSIAVTSKMAKADNIDALVKEITRGQQKGGIKQALVCSVNSDTNNRRLRAALQSLGIEVFFAQSSARFGQLLNAYSQPDKMGVDRWLAMIAAFQLSQAGSFAVLDLGSAITLDIVNAKAQHMGGHIVPGAAQLVQTLSQMDQIQLDPTINTKRGPQLGKNTEQCANLGCQQMVKQYLTSLFIDYQQQYQIKQWFITGGGALDWLQALLSETQVEGKAVDKQIKTAVDQLIYLPDLNFYGLLHLFDQIKQK